jgi:Nitrile hydratase, alpha chain
MAETETSTPWTRAIARAMKEKTFRTRLVANPTFTLTAAGVEIPVGVTIKVVENTATEVYMVLPHTGDDQLSDIQLERVVAGVLGLKARVVVSEFCNVNGANPGTGSY